MRLAVVIGSAYQRNSQLPPLAAADLDAELLEERLSDAEAGFRVARFAAERGVADRIEQHIAGASEPVEQLLLCFSGYCALSEERGPALLLDGERLGTFSLRRLRGLLEHVAQRSAVIIDAAAVLEGGQSVDAVVRAMGETLTGGGGQLEALVAVRGSEAPQSSIGSSFIGFALTVLEWLAASRDPAQPVDLRWLHAAVQADERRSRALPSMGIYPSDAGFVLLPAQPEAGSPVTDAVEEEVTATAHRRPPDAGAWAEPDEELTPSRPIEREALPAFVPTEEDAEEETGTRGGTALPSFAHADDDRDEITNTSRAVLGELFDPRSGIAPESLPAFDAPPDVFDELVVQPKSERTEPLPSFAASGDALDELLGAPRARSSMPSEAELLARYDGTLDDVAGPSEGAGAVAQWHDRAVSLEQQLEQAPGELSLRDDVIDAWIAAGNGPRALEHCRAAARIAPAHPNSYRRAQSLFESAGATDQAFLAASVLDALGEADINEALLASQHKPDGLPAVRGVVAEQDFRDALLGEDRDEPVWALLGALGMAGVRASIAIGKSKERHLEPDPGLLQDPERSTTMLAKTLGWTARLMGLPVPALYVLPELSAGLDVGATDAPSVLVSRQLGSGLGLGELAFLWGRHLPRLRPELRALSLVRSPAELYSLVTAALALVDAPGFSARTLEGDAKRAHAALKRDVRGEDLEAVAERAREFPVQDIAVRVERALGAVELVGVRAGLLACGDVGAAAELVRRVPLEGRTQMDEQLGELFAFAISDAYALLRRRIGVAVGG